MSTDLHTASRIRELEAEVRRLRERVAMARQFYSATHAVLTVYGSDNAPRGWAIVDLSMGRHMEIDGCSEWPDADAAFAVLDRVLAAEARGS